jgi:hypothetical protein
VPKILRLSRQIPRIFAQTRCLASGAKRKDPPRKCTDDPMGWQSPLKKRAVLAYAMRGCIHQWLSRLIVVEHCCGIRAPEKEASDSLCSLAVPAKPRPCRHWPTGTLIPCIERCLPGHEYAEGVQQRPPGWKRHPNAFWQVAKFGWPRKWPCSIATW